MRASRSRKIYILSPQIDKEISKHIPVEQVCPIDEVVADCLGGKNDPKIIVSKVIAIKKI